MENNRPLGWTTLEEAKLLVDAGLDPNTADMYYYARQRFDSNEYVNTGEWNLCHRCDKEKGYGGDDDFSGEEHFQYLLKTFGASKYDDDDDCFVPCWSLGALIELMPYEITYEEDIYRILITQKYVSYPRLTTLWPSLYGSKSDSVIESAVNIIIKLIENGYIKKHE